MWVANEPVKGTSPTPMIEPDSEPVVTVLEEGSSVTYETTSVVPSVPIPITSPPSETPAIGAMEVGRKTVAVCTCA